jgi:hypothetical protein
MEKSGSFVQSKLIFVFAIPQLREKPACAWALADRSLTAYENDKIDHIPSVKFFKFKM